MIRTFVNFVRHALGVSMLDMKISRLEDMLKIQLETATTMEARHRALTAVALPTVLSNSISQKQILDFCSLLAPHDVEGFGKIRMGNENDGGYVFIDDFADVATVISCGIYNDVTFDVACADMGKAVIQFDHTVDGPPVKHPKFTFRKQAIDALDRIPGSVKLWDIVREYSRPGKPDLLLKIDIEGHEWATFANFPAEDLKRVRQISIELHSTSRLIEPEFYELYFRALKNINASFFAAHLHANNFQGMVNLMGVPVAEVFEVTFVNRELYRPAGNQHGAPTALDNPNDVSKPDLVLRSPYHIS